jgi:hypothetical protein
VITLERDATGAIESVSAAAAVARASDHRARIRDASSRKVAPFIR